MEASEIDDYKDGIDLYWCFLITIETEPIQDFTDPPMINYEESYMKIKDIGRGIDNFQLFIVIGKFGKVHLAQDKHTNKIVAIKVIKKKSLSQEDCIDLYVYLLFNENIMN